MAISEESGSIISQGRIDFIGSWRTSYLSFLGKHCVLNWAQLESGDWKAFWTSLCLLCAVESRWWPEAMIYLWLTLRTSASYLMGNSMPLTFSKHSVPGHLVGTGNTRRDESLFTQRAHNITNTFIIIHTKCESWMILCRNHVSWSHTYKIFKKCRIFYSF